MAVISRRRPRLKPVYEHPDPEREKVDRTGRHLGLAWVENVFFVLVMLLAFAFGILLLTEVRWSPSIILFLIFFWATMAYLALPRLHRVLTSIYVPDYFIGRSRTTDGLLGDPINMALTGTEAQIHEAMTSAGWVKADPITLGTSWRIVVGSLLRRSYPEAPVSPLVLFKKTQAFAYQQEVEGNPSQRHHVRFWPTPSDWLLPGGYRVDWLASGTYDRAVGLSLFTLQVTHKIDRFIDVERDYVIGTVQHAQPAAGVHVIKDFSTGYHSRNGGGDAVVTDGDLPVLELENISVEPAVEAELKALARARKRDDIGRRPTAIIAAVALTAASFLLAALDLLLRWNDVKRDYGPDVVRDDLPNVPPGVLALGALAVFLPLFFLAWRTYQGGVVARLVMIAVVTASQLAQMWQFLEGTRATTSALLALSIDLLLVYALTSLAAREWTDGRRAENEGAQTE